LLFSQAPITWVYCSASHCREQQWYRYAGRPHDIGGPVWICSSSPIVRRAAFKVFKQTSIFSSIDTCWRA
jgi:hypothetical protein